MSYDRSKTNHFYLPVNLGILWVDSGYVDE